MYAYIYIYTFFFFLYVTSGWSRLAVDKGFPSYR